MRDIIQENRVLGPGDLNMQSLTLEDVPVQPEVCENANTITGSEQLEAGSEEDFLVLKSVKQGSNVSLEFLENNLLENEGQILDSSNDKSCEQMKVSDYREDNSNIMAEENCANDVGKRPADDILESDFHAIGDVQGSPMSMITERLDESKIDTNMGEVDEVAEIDGPLPYSEAAKIDLFVGPTETSDSNGCFEGSMAIENGEIQKSVMDMRKKTVTKSNSDSEELQAETASDDIVSVNKAEKIDSFLGPMYLDVGLEMHGGVKDLQEKSAWEMTTETVEKSNSEIKKDGRGQSSESNDKMSLNKNKKSPSSVGSAEIWDSNGGLEAARTVVEVEQFPLPIANSSLNSELPDCVSASAGVEEREMVKFKKLFLLLIVITNNATW
jgi:hypothetical protein